MAQLEPITVPEENRPKPGTVKKVAEAHPTHTPVEEPKIPLSRYKAKFEGDKQTT